MRSCTSQLRAVTGFLSQRTLPGMFWGDVSETYTIRQATRDDIPAILQLWNERLLYDQADPEKVSGFFGCEFYQPGSVLVAMSGSEMAAFIFAGTRDKTGWIPVFAVRPDWTDSGVGDELVGRIESLFRRIGVETVKIEQLFFRSWMDTRYADLLAIFERCGYQWIWQEHELDGDIYKDLRGFTLPDWIIQARESLAAERITFGFCEPELRRAYLEFMDTHLAGYKGWRQMARDYVDSEGDPLLRILALRGEEAVGFTQLAKETSWYIPATGVREDLRRKRIGSVLVYLALEEIVRRGADHMWICDCPLDFYKMVDGEITRRYVQLKKKLTG